MGTAARPVIELLDTTRHDRAGFSCGVEALDRYLQSQAGQDARRRVAFPYVLIEPPSPNVLGFYTLSNTSLQAAELPATLVKKLPRYPVLPATLLGRLAVDGKGRGKGLGGSVAKIVKLEHAWRRLDGRNDDGFQVAPFPG